MSDRIDGDAVFELKLVGKLVRPSRGVNPADRGWRALLCPSSNRSGDAIRLSRTFFSRLSSFLFFFSCFFARRDLLRAATRAQNAIRGPTDGGVCPVAVAHSGRRRLRSRGA